MLVSFETASPTTYPFFALIRHAQRDPRWRKVNAERRSVARRAWRRRRVLCLTDRHHAVSGRESRSRILGVLRLVSRRRAVGEHTTKRCSGEPTCASSIRNSRSSKSGDSKTIRRYARSRATKRRSGYAGVETVPGRWWSSSELSWRWRLATSPARSGQRPTTGRDLQFRWCFEIG